MIDTRNGVALSLPRFPCTPADPLRADPTPGAPAAPPPAAAAYPEEQFSSKRCAEKGCIFPARPGAKGTCLYHDREQREPASFESRQPSRLLLEYAKFGVGEFKLDDTRARDRRRWVTVREDFLEVAS
jgi:hypothetical protein